MSIMITGCHMTVTPALRRHLEERSERLTRYGVELGGCQFALSVEKYRHAAEGVVTVNRRIVQGKVSTQEMYGAIDRLMEKL
jgi:putative sigma-54 modulation protein